MTTTEPFLSIVTVTKDNLAGLLSTKESIDAQFCLDFEWIVIDGASADGSECLPFVTVSEPDSGIYDAMNKGLGRARGDYIIFMNAGDRFSDADIVREVRRAAEGTGADFLYGDALEQGGFYKKARDAKRISFGMPTHHQAMIYRRAAIKDRYETGYKIASDYDFTARFLLSGASMHYMPCAICIFEEGGVSQQRRGLGRREQFSVRRTRGIGNAFTNVSIYGIQSLSAFLRVRMNFLYRFLRGHA